MAANRPELGEQVDLPQDFRVLTYCRAEAVEPELFARLVRAGLTQVHLGLESGSRQVLARLGKGQDLEGLESAVDLLRALGIQVVPSFITFEQRQTAEELCESLQWMARRDLCEGFGTGGLLPIPGTRAASELVRDGLVPSTHRWSDVFRPVSFADPRVRWVAEAVRRFESALDRGAGRLRVIATAYHHHTDCLEVASGEQAAADVVRYRHFRRLEVRLALAALEESILDPRVTGTDPVPQWLARWADGHLDDAPELHPPGPRTERPTVRLTADIGLTATWTGQWTMT